MPNPTAQAKHPTQHSPESPYLSPKELANRWRCARSTAQRIAHRAGITRLYLGEGRNGIVRYPRKEIEAYETNRQVKP
jgi:hypothetical protein